MRGMTTRTLRPAALLALVAFAAAAGCGQDPGIRDRYVAEKLAWEAGKNAHAMTTNPGLATDEMRERVADSYQEIVRRFPPPSEPEGLSRAQKDVALLAARSRMKLGEMAAASRDADAAASYFASVRDSYSFDRSIAVEAAIALAETYEVSGRWPDAVEAYDRLTRDWPPAVSEQGIPDARIMRAPIRIATGHVARGDRESGAEWFGRARRYYDTLAERLPGSGTAELAMTFKAETFLMQERWQEAVEAYQLLDRTYGHDGNRPGIWLTLADTYANRLNQEGTARTYYEKVVATYPDDVAAATAALALSRDEIERSRHESARARLTEVARRFADEEAIRATAIHYLAASYEAEGLWDEALKQLNALAREHPTTMYGLTALQHIAEHYDEAGEKAAATAALERAADHYQRVIRDYASTPAELAARGYLIDTRLRQERWEDAAKALVETAQRFPDSESSPGMLLQAADIYSGRLADNASAERVLRSMMTQYEGRPAAAQAQRLLATLTE